VKVDAATIATIIFVVLIFVALLFGEDEGKGSRRK